MRFPSRQFRRFGFALGALALSLATLHPLVHADDPGNAHPCVACSSPTLDPQKITDVPEPTFRSASVAIAPTPDNGRLTVVPSAPPRAPPASA